MDSHACDFFRVRFRLRALEPGARAGRHEDKVHEGSGLLASMAVAESLEPYTRDRIAGLAKETPDEALASARRTNSTYLVYPRIVRWVDRAAISAKPEAAEVHVSVVEVATGRTVNTAQLVGQGQVVLRPSGPRSSSPGR